MDEVAKHNSNRWDALGEVNALLSQPDRQIDPQTARHRYLEQGRLGSVQGKRVLCLASGGGHQACALAMLGAAVTLVDLSASQLQRDRQAAVHYGVNITAIQADMRDLSMLPPRSFDIVYQPYSINFIPDCTVVFDQVQRVIRSGGIYQLVIANPFTLGTMAKHWSGAGYPLHRPYENGAKLVLEDEDWFYRGASGDRSHVPPPIEYRHTLGTVLNGLIDRGFRLDHFQEDPWQSGEHQPGTWSHLKMIAPPWFTLWLILQ